MLNRGTLPSRPDLLKLCDREFAAPIDDLWRGLQFDDLAALVRVADVYFPRLDHYLYAGLGVQHANVRDAIVTEAITLFAELGRGRHHDRLEMQLYQVTRMQACLTGCAPQRPPLPLAGPVQLELGLELLKRNIVSAIARVEHRVGSESRDDSDPIAFAAHAAHVGIATPVWFAEPRFLSRIGRARAVYATLVEAASELAPPCLSLDDRRARSNEIDEAFQRVWLSLPLATREARTLWGLNLSVADIAEILGLSIATADTALLQLLTITTAFNALLGRTPTGPHAPEVMPQCGLGLLAA